MSHVAAIDILISKDPAGMEALEAACKELGLVFLKDKKTFEWFGKWVDDYSAEDAAYIRAGIDPKEYGKCIHAIKVPGSQYEIGIVNRPDGKGYTLIYDFYGPGRRIMEKLGKGCEKLKQMYGVHKATIAAKQRGYMVQRQTLSCGSIKLQITGVK
jgi:hypothetical protein